MKKAKVYYTSMRAKPGDNLLQKLARLMNEAGFSTIDLEGKYTAIKLHFGEPGNLAFLRPNFAKVVADQVKKQGGKPFLTDCSTLYVGRRKDALEHMDAAYENGFSPFSTGCQIIIGDGLKGSDEILIPVKGGEFIKDAKIGRAVMDADVFISLNHFKGHEATGFGGALKNIGMGCGSRAGKMEMHNAGKPYVDTAKCVGCNICLGICAFDAIKITAGKAAIDESSCVGCGRCLAMCPKDAIRTKWDESNSVLNKKIAEYTLAVLEGRPHFHISLAMDISPNCDCRSENDMAIIPNVGMFASFDPVALDMACADMCNKMPVMPGSLLEEVASCDHKHDDHFDIIHPETSWIDCVNHSEKLGIGTKNYELIEVK
ncbi:MAG: DUF362 domain-containing protein [Defluviitaleaceae bacterium]|nr:DUF362 domain-containing protein [Defluviitaleaceae bacterium]